MKAYMKYCLTLKRSFPRIFSLVFTTLLAINSYAHELDGQTIHRIPQLKVITDENESFSFDDVLLASDTLEKTNWRYLATKGTVWLVIDVPKSIADGNGHYLSIRGNASRLEIYHYDKVSGWNKHLSGQQSGSYLKESGLLYPVQDLGNLDSNYPIMIKMVEAVVPVVFFEKKEGIYAKQYLKLIVTSVFIGSLLFILVINLFRWILTRELVFGIYTLYMFTFILHILAFGGNNSLYNIISITPYQKFTLHLVAIFAMNAVASIYGIIFLRLKTENKVIYYLLLIFASLSVFVVILTAIYPGLATTFTNTSLIVLLILLFWAGVIQYRKGHTYVYLYVIAYLIFAIFLIAYTWQRNIDYAFPFLYPVPLFYIGILVEAFLLNVSLNLRIDFEKQQAIEDKEKAQQENIAYQRQQNLVLEEKVAERTEELQNALDTIKQTQSQLVASEKMASIGVLSAGIGHEINNPLNFIKGGVEGLSLQLKDQSLKGDKTTQEYIHAISEGVDRASSIVNSLSHFSHTGTDMEEVCNVHEIIDNCLVILQSELKHRIEIIKDYSESEICLPGNEGRLHQALLNILINAEQAIKDSGRITIKTSQKKDEIDISITDTGTGISKANIAKIMDPFFTTKKPGEGTGLGLAITYRIIEEHGGKIDVSSEEKKGTQFKITLPVIRQ